MNTSPQPRCFGNGKGKEFYADYHDNEWGIPVHDDRHLFEMLILEGAQAGLSWETILKRRRGYRDAFYNFDPVKVAAMRDDELEALRNNEKIIRNKLKIYAARKNAQVFLHIQKEFGSFDTYLWAFVNHKPIKNNVKSMKEIIVTSPQSDTSPIEALAKADSLAKDLKKRGMTFVGSTIMYAFMQAVGMVNDHTQECWKYQP